MSVGFHFFRFSSRRQWRMKRSEGRDFNPALTAGKNGGFSRSSHTLELQAGITL